MTSPLTKRLEFLDERLLSAMTHALALQTAIAPYVDVDTRQLAQKLIMALSTMRAVFDCAMQVPTDVGKRPH